MIVTLTEIRPESQYEGKVYSQDIFIETRDGKELRVDDAKKLSGEALVGDDVRIRLKADDIREVRTNVANDYALVPREGTTGLDKIRGEITTIIDNKPNKYVFDVNVGAGTITCHVYKDVGTNFEPKEGDWVELGQILGLYLEEIEAHSPPSS